MTVMAKRKPKKKTWAALAEAREKRGQTQADAAEKVGITQGTWSAVESGLRQPSRQLRVLLELYISGKPLFPS